MLLAAASTVDSGAAFSSPFLGETLLSFPGKLQGARSAILIPSDVPGWEPLAFVSIRGRIRGLPSVSISGCIRAPVCVHRGLYQDSCLCPSGVASEYSRLAPSGGCIRTPVCVRRGLYPDSRLGLSRGCIRGLPCVSVGGLYQDSRLGPSGIVSGLPSGSARGRIRGPLSVSTGETYQRTPQGPAVLPPSPGAPLPPGAVWDQAAMLPGGPVVACGPLWIEA